MTANIPRLDSPAKILALFFGAGCAPWAPGTIGTLAAVPLYLVLTAAGSFVYIAVTLVVVLVGVWACGRAADELGVHDHPAIVIDEVAGYLVTMALIPFSWVAVVAGFTVFRLLDIFKPWPIGRLDLGVPGGAGIMADDIAAGLIANVILWLLLALLPV